MNVQDDFDGNLTSKESALNEVKNIISTLRENLIQNQVIMQNYLDCVDTINTIITDQQVENIVDGFKNNIVKIKDEQIDDCLKQLQELQTVKKTLQLQYLSSLTHD